MLYMLRPNHNIFRGLAPNADPGLRRMRYGQLATAMMQILVRYGSPIEVLHFKPACAQPRTNVTPVADENGHIWPEYCYKRGVVAFPGDGRPSAASTVAVPISYEDMRHVDPRREWERHGMR
jgi:hypothetical protein